MTQTIRRIAVFAHNIVRGDGQGRINYELVRHCLTQGHRVTMFADAYAPELLGFGAVAVPVRPSLRQPNILKVRNFVSIANSLLRARREHFDVVIGNGYVLTEPHDVNLCQFVHGAWIHSPVHVSRLRGGPYGWYQRQYTVRNAKWERISYRAASIVVAPSKKIAAELIQIGVPREKLRVIPNGVDPEEFYPSPQSRDELGLPKQCLLALFAGDIRTPRKNLDSVLKALVELPEFHLAVVGAVKRSPFPAMAAELGVSNRVHFLDFRRDVANIMRASDLFVFPSRYEAGSLVLLEAMASGLPVLTAESAGGSELVGDGGVVIKNPDDVAAIVTSMRRFADEQYRRATGNAARRIAELHSWRHMAERYASLFQDSRDEIAGREPQLCYAD